jgi:hypothetical protein
VSESKWQDIGTAPKDGTDILVWDGDSVSLSHWDEGWVYTDAIPEVWHRSESYRWAALEGTTSEPPVLQVAWASNKGRLEWRRVETVVVSREEYGRT